MLSVMGDDIDVDGDDGDVDGIEEEEIVFVASNRCITKQARSWSRVLDSGSWCALLKTLRRRAKALRT